jgi:hypothetical protein
VAALDGVIQVVLLEALAIRHQHPHPKEIAAAIIHLGVQLAVAVLVR